MLADGLAPTVRPSIESHVDGCRDCQQRLEELTRSPEQWIGRSDATPLQRCGLVPIAATLAHDSQSTPTRGIVDFNDAQPDPPALAGYQIIGELGRGGMGVVYQARQISLGRTVAIKVLRHAGLGRADELFRFRREGEVLARLSHPNIVQVIEVGVSASSPYLVMEYVDGGTLQSALPAARCSPREAASFIRTLAEAVHTAHQRGIIHRDLKPANILLARRSDGEENCHSGPSDGLLGYLPKIADFGLAKNVLGDSHVTDSHAFLGTPSYMAPEQAAGDPREVGVLADVYALGVLLYELLCGRPPFLNESPAATLLQVVHTQPAPPRRLNPLVPIDLATIVERCLAKRPADRYQSAAALADDLRRFLGGEPIHARAVGKIERIVKWSRRQPALAALAGAVVALVGVGVPLVTMLWLRATNAHRSELSEREIAVSQRDAAQRALYASRVSLADKALRDHDVSAAKRLLAQCVPREEQPDLRGWEWHYLMRRCWADRFPGMTHESELWNWVHSVAFHPRLPIVASVGGLPPGEFADRSASAIDTPGDLKLWNTLSGSLLGTFRGHRGAISDVAWVSMGQRLVTHGVDGGVIVWDGDFSKQAPTLVGRSLVLGGAKRASDVQVSPNGRWLAIATLDEVQLWNLNSWSIEWRRPLAESLFWRAAFRHDSSRLVCTNRMLPGHVWDTATGEPTTGEFPVESVSLAAQSPTSGIWALVRPESSTIHLWDPHRKAYTQELRGHNNTIQCLAFAGDGTLVSGGNDRVIRLWDVGRNVERLALDGHSIGVVSVAIDPSGGLLVSGGKDSAVKLWDLSRDPRGRRFAATDSGEHLATWCFAPTSDEILVLAGSLAKYDLTTWSAHDGKILRKTRLAMENIVAIPHRSYGFSGNAARVAGITNDDPQSVHVWDVATGRDLRTAKTTYQRAGAPVLDHDGKRFAYSARSIASPPSQTSARSEWVVRDVDNGEILLRGETPAGHVITSLALSSDRLAVARVGVITRNGSLAPGKTASIELYDLGAERVERSIDADTGYVTAISFSRDGRFLAAATADHRLYAWRSNNGEGLFPPTECSTQLTSVTFSPDNGRIAATGFDSNVYLWDAASGGELLSLRGLGPPGTGHYGFTARVHFSPDGKRLAANSWRGDINVWSIED